MQKNRPNVVAILTVFICLIMVAPVMAGQGNGSGGGVGNPLELVSSTPADGDTGVALDTEIRLSFSKNVVNMQVKDINQGCFSLYADNIPVQVEVVMADDQIEPEYKRDIVLVPGEELKPGTNYTIEVAPEFQSKSGTSLEKELKISFTTAGSANVSTTKDAEDTMADEGEKGYNATVAAIIAAIIIAGGLLYAYFRRKK